MNHPTLIGILAAGAGRRMQQHGVADKLLAPVQNASVLEWSLRFACTSQRSEPLVQVAVVVGPEDDKRRAVADACGVRVLVAAEAARGIRWSIHTLLAAAAHHDQSLAIVLADDPLAIRALPAVLQVASNETHAIVAVRRSSSAPHPVWLSRSVVSQLALHRPSGDDDHGLASLLATAKVHWIDPSKELADVQDVDEPHDLIRLDAAIRALDDVHGS